MISRKNPNFILKIFFDIMNLSATETESERNTFELIVWKVAIFVCFDSKFVRTFHCPNKFFWRSKLFFREIESQRSFLDFCHFTNLFSDIMNIPAIETESDQNTFELIVWKVAIFVCFGSKFIRTFHCPRKFFLNNYIVLH